MKDKVYLGIDLGAESGRVMAGRWDGRRMALEEIHRFPNGPTSIAGTLRWNVLGLWREVEAGLAKAAARFGQAIVSVGVDTWGVDYVLLSKTDELLGLPYHYRDGRNRGMIDELLGRMPRERVFAETGLQFMEINTLCQLLAHQRDHPEILALADRLLLVPDYFHWLLCGARVCEFTNATTTQCVHPSTRDWSAKVIAAAGLPPRLFSEIVPPGTTLGALRREVIERTGLPESVKVVAPPTHDTAAAVAGTPGGATGRRDWAYLSSGTWSLLGLESDEALLGPKALAANVTNEGGVDGTYRVLKNIMGLWIIQECRRAWVARGLELDYARLMSLAEAASPSDARIDPDDSRFLNPPDMLQAIADHCRERGQAVPAEPGDIARCVLESLARRYAQALALLEGVSGARVERIHVVGGGSRIALLNRLTAEATGREVVAGPVEATALGNVLTQARTDGEVGSLSEARAIVRLDLA